MIFKSKDKDELEEVISPHVTASTVQGVSLENLDEDAKEIVIHLIECYEDNCFTKDERITLADLVLQAKL